MKVLVTLKNGNTREYHHSMNVERVVIVDNEGVGQYGIDENMKITRHPSKCPDNNIRNKKGGVK